VWISRGQGVSVPLSAAMLAAMAGTAEGSAVVGFLQLLAGAAFLGAVTDGLLLGHWYLVDPRLSRRPLRRLALGALTGIVLDTVILAVHGGLSWSPAEAGVGWAYVGLSVVSVLLVLAVWLALKEPAYSAVMAATGLSYLAVLTVIGAGVAGRSLVAEGLGLLAVGTLTWL